MKEERTEPEAAQDALSEAIRLLIELVYPDVDQRPENAAQRLLRVHEDYAPNIALFTRFLSTGTPDSREHAGTVIRGALALMNESMNPDDGDHPDDFQDAYYPLSTVNASRVWNTVNVLNECDQPEDDPWDKIFQQSMLETLHPCLDPERQGNPEDDEYWRGASLLSLTGLHPKESDVPGFIQWAGASRNPRGVLDAAKERDTLNVATLIGVMNEQAKVASPLQNGAL
jgi:hypothetical protein